MATGLDRREQVAETTRTASREYNPQSQGLVQVGGPRGDNGAGMRQHAAELDLMLGAATNIATTQVANWEERQRVEGAMLYQQGKSEHELAQSGANRYTVTGFKVARLNTEAMKWIQLEDEQIQMNNMSMTPDEYRQYLGDKFTGIMEQAGDDPQAKAILTNLSEKAMPQLLSRQIGAHETWKQDQTALAYADNLMAVASTSASTVDEVEAWMDNNISEQMPDGLRNKMLTMALEQSIDSDNMKVFQAFEKRGGVAGFQFSESERESVTRAQERYDGRMEAKVRQNLTDSLARIDLDLEKSGNFSQAREAIGALRGQYGDKFGTAVFDNAQVGIERQYKSYMKEQEESTLIGTAMAAREMWMLPKSEQQKGYALQEANIIAQVQAEVAAGKIDPTEAQGIANRMIITGVADQQVVNEKLSREFNGRLGLTLLDETGKVSQDAEDSFDKYLLLKKTGGARLAAEHISDPDVRTKLEIAEAAYLDTGDPRAALARAEQVVSDNEKLSYKQRIAKFDSTVSSFNIEQQLDKLQERITPSFFTSTLGPNASPWLLGQTVTDDEIEKAVRNNVLRSQVRGIALRKLVTTPGMKEAAAVKAAYDDIITRGDFVLGTFVVPEGKGNIRKDMGFETNEYNVADLAMKEYLKEFGPKIFTPKDQFEKGRTNPDYNKFEWSSFGKSVRTVGRGVPELDVTYMSESKTFVVNAYKDKAKTEPLTAVPVFIPAKEIGDYYRTLASSDKASTNMKRQVSKSAYHKQMKEIKAKWMPETYGDNSNDRIAY